MMRIHLTVLWFVACAAFAPAGVAQDITVQINSNPPVHVTASDIAAIPHQKLTVDDHGKSVSFEGVPLWLVLEKAGLVFDNSMHSKRLTSYLRVNAADGYRVIFALPELDPGFTDKVILLADRSDGHALDSKQGPFRIVVPGEKRMARWVRQVVGLKVVEVGDGHDLLSRDLLSLTAPLLAL